MTRTRLGAVVDGLTMVVLVVSALFGLVVQVLYLPIYVGGSWTAAARPSDIALASGAQLAAPLGSGAIALPVTALIAAVMNIGLVAAMRTITDSLRLALLPVAVWTLGFLWCTFPGPGGDVLLMSEWPTLLLLVCGTVVPLLYAVNAGTASPAPTRAGR